MQRQTGIETFLRPMLNTQNAIHEKLTCMPVFMISNMGKTSIRKWSLWFDKMVK